MKFVNLNEYRKISPLAVFYPQKDFGGHAQELGRGNYQMTQLLEKPMSIKFLDSFASVVFYENADQSGRKVVMNADCADLNAAIEFEPAIITVTLHAKGMKNGVQEGSILFGVYGTESIGYYDEIVVPNGMYVIFYGNGKDKNALRYFSNETFSVDTTLDAYSAIAVLIFGNIDALLGISEAELSPDELLAVVGGMQDDEDNPVLGACKIEGCAAKCCAADAPCAANV